MPSKLHPREVIVEPRFGIQLNGKDVGEDMLKYVERVLVEDEDNMIPMATISIKDVERTWLDDKGFVKGTKVSISIGHSKSFRKVFNGSITYIDGNFPEQGFPDINIVCSDLAVGMLAETKARSWKKKKVSEVIEALHKEKNVKVIVEDTKVVLDHIVMEEGTRIDFVLEWKKRLGAKYYKINDDTYYFGTKSRNVKATTTLGYKTGGHEIMTFAPVYQEIEKEDDISSTEVDENGKEIKSAAQLQPSYAKLANAPVGKAVPKKK